MAVLRPRGGLLSENMGLDKRHKIFDHLAIVILLSLSIVRSIFCIYTPAAAAVAAAAAAAVP